MAKNNFKPFATGAGANVMSQADWEALPALLSGFTAGKAFSAQVNKAIRQASFIAAALAQYTANKSGLDVLDDGDVAGFISKMSTAFGKDFQALDATLTALAGLATGANKLPYFTGTDTAAQTDLTSVGRDIIGKSTIADILTYLGLVDTDKLAGRLLAPPMVITASGQFLMPSKGNLFRIRVQGAGGGSGSARATSTTGLSASGGGVVVPTLSCG
ncbi:phage tail protein [Enterobacter roggenkampii]|nr:phage tail protein [Enterobacter roggenkampii]WIJ78056.1 phage tail protein [Enterobacter roggenkampii]